MVISSSEIYNKCFHFIIRTYNVIANELVSTLRSNIFRECCEHPCMYIYTFDELYTFGNFCRNIKDYTESAINQKYVFLFSYRGGKRSNLHLSRYTL
mgnify:CR=1 FL=1